MRESFLASRAVIALAVALAATAFACAKDSTSPREAMPDEFAGAPDWVIEGCSAYPGEDAPTKICGVGSFSGSKNISLSRTASRARGRTEIARSLDVQVKSMLKDYQATTTGGEEFGTAAADEQHVVDVSKQITDISLSGTEIKDTWISPTGTYYTLMVLDVERFRDSVDKMSNLSEDLRAAISDRADKSFAELNDELARQQR